MTGLAIGTGGYEADPDEARAIALSEIEPILEGWPGDLLAQYGAITSRQVTMQAAVDIIATERARVVAAMNQQGGLSYARIADALGMSRSRAQQLCNAGRDAAVHP